MQPERLLLLLLFAAALILIIQLVRRRQQQLLTRAAEVGLPADLLTPGRPTVVAFSLPGCRDCRTRQAPVLNRLRAHGDITVHTLHAAEHAQLVDRYGIMTVPATLVVGADGRLRALNHGFADLPTLQQQLGLGA